MWVQSLGRKDPLEKGKATHSSILIWRIPWTGESGRLYSSRGRKESDKTKQLTLSLFTLHAVSPNSTFIWTLDYSEMLFSVVVQPKTLCESEKGSLRIKRWKIQAINSRLFILQPLPYQNVLNLA